MKGIISILWFLVLLLLPCFGAKADVSVPVTPLGSDLMGVVTDAQWSAKGGSALAYDSAQQGFPFFTKDDGTPNHKEMAELIQSPLVTLQAGKQYQFVLRMKADQFPQGQTINFKAESNAAEGHPYEASRTSTWNVSRAGEWEDVYIPVRPQYDKSWHIQVWVSTTTSFAATPSRIYIAPDVDVYELPAGQEVATLHGVNTTTDKDSFVSSTQRIDGLGNIYTKNENSTIWKHVFPRMIYRDTPVADYLPMFQRYKNYGFTGVMNISDVAGAQAAIVAGLEHLSINANSGGDFSHEWTKMDAVYQWANQKDLHHNIVWYNYDNENSWVGNLEYQDSLRTNVDTHHVDPQTHKRRHPVYFLNGNVGVPRTYHNDERTVMDITGSYVGSDAQGVYADLNPEPTLLIEFMSQNQRAPVTVIELQTGIGKTFIPSLFYGIIQGGRAMCVWRDGGSQPKLESTDWGAAFRDDVSPKLDQMLPLIEQPHFTSWKAVTDQYPTVRIGTRELNGADYLILANFAVMDEQATTMTLPVTVTLQNTQATKAVDFFTGAEIATVSNGQFTFPLGYHNNGYRVIRLIKPFNLLLIMPAIINNVDH